MASLSLPPSTRSQGGAFLKSNFCTKMRRPPPSLSLTGKTALVTGSNSGIGLAAAEQLLSHGISHLIMAVRTPAKGERCAEPLRQKYPAARISVWELDMLSYASIRAFVARLQGGQAQRRQSQEGDDGAAASGRRTLDLAILNAGIAEGDFKLAPETGHETTFQTNYLSTALLAILLLPILRPSPPPQQRSSAPSVSSSRRDDPEPGRLTIVGSAMGLWAEFGNRDAAPLIPSFDEKPRNWGPQAGLERYSVSKTLVLMLLQKLGEVVSSRDVVVNAVEPGLTKGSDLMRSLPPGPMAVMFTVMKAVAARTTEEAAWSYVDAVAVKGEETHGGWLVDWEVHPLNSMQYTPEGRQITERLWEETLRELNEFGVSQIIYEMRARK